MATTSSTSIIVIFTYLVFLLILVGLPVIIGVYVYRDAKRRNMNAALWTLITILAPSLIGFIIYLFVRGNYDELKCAKCNASVSREYIVCPSCGAKLKPVCTNCNEPVAPDWKVCPKCAQPLSNCQEDVITPVRKKDKTLQRILLVVIIIPIAIIIIMLIAMISFRVNTATGGMGTMETTVESYLEGMSEPEIEQWLESCEAEPETAYVLEYKEEESDDEERVRYLIYIPNASLQSSGIIEGFFGTTLKVEFESVDKEENIVLITWTGDEITKLKIYLDDKKLDIQTTESDYSPALSDQELEDLGADYTYQQEKIIEIE